jgi:hypothetical protein
VTFQAVPKEENREIREMPVVVITVVLGLGTFDISSWTKPSGRDVLLYDEATKYRTDLLYSSGPGRAES